MAQPIRSTIPALLLNLQAVLMADLGLGQERVIIDTENDETDDTHYQAEQVVFIRKGSQTPERGHVGLGRVWAAERVRMAFTLYTRCALDDPPGFQVGLTDPILGHEVWTFRMRDVLSSWQPTDAAGNWLVQEPLIPAGGTGPTSRMKADWTWARSTLWYIMIYAPALDQAYQ